VRVGDLVKIKIGDLVRVIEKDKEEWAKHNPWMYRSWGLLDKHIVLKSYNDGENWEVLNIQTNETNLIHADNLEVISESR